MTVLSNIITPSNVLTTTNTATVTNKTFGDNPTFSGGTANGVTFLNGSKVLTSGSALTFDGSNFKLTGSDNNNLVYSANSNGTASIRIQSNAAGNYLVAVGPNPLYFDNGSASGFMSFAPASSTEGMRLTSTGLGIGTSSPSVKLHVKAATASADVFYAVNSNNRGLNVNTTASDNLQISHTNSNYNIDYWVSGTGVHTFSTGGSERARITSGGQLLVGSTTGVVNAGTTQLYVKTTGGDYAGYFESTNTSPYGGYIKYSGASPNSTGFEFLVCGDTSATRIQLRSNGGFGNYSGNNVNLSDRREKTNFALATSYLDKICAIPVQTFNYIDQNMEDDDGLTLGVVAQDVQAVAPELVTESNWGTEEEPKMRLSIYQTDLQYALMKCIQEQQAIIESLKARLDAANL